MTLSSVSPWCNWLKLTEQSWHALLLQSCVSMRAPSLIWSFMVKMWVDRDTEMRSSNLYFCTSRGSVCPSGSFSLHTARAPQAFLNQEHIQTSLTSVFVPICLQLSMRGTCWVDVFISEIHNQWPLRSSRLIQEWSAILQQQMQPRAVHVQMGNSLHLQRRLYLVLNDWL